MSYSSPAQLRAFQDRLPSAGARSAQQWGQGGTAQDANIQLALNAGSLDIDAAAAIGGYPTPITQAGLGCTDEQWTKALAWLQMLEICLALQANTFPIDDTPKVKSRRDPCAAKLAALASGKALPGGDASVGGGFEYVSTTGVGTVNYETLQRGAMGYPWP